MKLGLSTFAAAIALLSACTTAPAPSPGPPPGVGAPIVFFDIAGPDMTKQSAFYETVFGWTAAADNPFPAVSRNIGPVNVIAPLPGTLRTDPADKRLYIGVEDVTAALAQIAKQGGVIEAPRFEVPGVVVLGLFRDPAGNTMGLVEIKDGKPVIP
jgi:uncharacterized protein